MSQDQHNKAQAFAELHKGPGAFVIPNPWDIGSTQILTGMGFKALATTSAGYAFSQGLKDAAVSRTPLRIYLNFPTPKYLCPIKSDPFDSR